MDESEELGRRISDLSEHLLAEETVEKGLYRVADLAVRFLPSCDACGVSMVVKGLVSTRVASGPMAQRVDAHQYAVNEGPCLDAVRTGRMLKVDSFAEEARWPRFVPMALEEGVVSSYSVPLKVGGRTVGALNLYSRSKAFDHQDEAMVGMIASPAAVALANAQAYHRIRDVVDQLNVALTSRDLIGQAKGIIMERESCSADQAFDVLRVRSQAGNQKLVDVARDVVDSTVGGAKP